MSSKRNVRRRRCERKVRHATREGAAIAAGRLRARTGDAIESYRCSHCGGWHIGHRNHPERVAA